MVHQFTTTEATKRLKDLIDAALRGETIRIVKDDLAGVELVPLPSVKITRNFGSAKGKVIMTNDFFAPMEDFNDYLK